MNVWIEAKDFSVFIYKMTQSFPKSEQYGITSQLNRATVSIPSNIAEGAGRSSTKEFSRFITIAIGSAYEVETQLIIALEIGVLSKEDFEKSNSKIIKIQKMLFNFNRHLKNKISST
ncbi:four helix bundle protein [Wenyingzhuangia aestuarii]|uniref:four helix bundle protein n=1 Tax=Wenyingzhuangia aestuarii TaxID=1647582 RepID=UPI001FD793E8|nr:four helix bundle protein [Wenyingzhuangia aestuarii]